MSESFWLRIPSVPGSYIDISSLRVSTVYHSKVDVLFKRAALSYGAAVQPTVACVKDYDRLIRHLRGGRERMVRHPGAHGKHRKYSRHADGKSQGLFV